MDSNLKVTGKLIVRVTDSSGKTIDVRELSNTVTTNGKAHIADQLAATPTQNKMGSMAIGTGTPSATALGTELSRKGMWSVTSSGSVTTYKAHWDIDDNVSGTITEAGIFNSTTLGGTMLASGSISPSISKTANSSLDITWTITIT